MGGATGYGVVIVGAGQAGDALATGLRQQGYPGSICLIGDEPHAPYRRPPLSKAFLAGEVPQESLHLRSQAAYEKLGIECCFGVAVTGVDRNARRVQLSNGGAMHYERLVLATGGHARELSLPGADRPEVHSIRMIADIQRLRTQFVSGRRLAVIGGGYIGLEVAAIAIKCGLQVTVLEALPRVLTRVTAPEISAFYQRAHSRRGVAFRTGVGVRAFEGRSRLEAVALADGTRVPADLAIVGVGLVPNTALAEAAGLAVANGIVVDCNGGTLDSSIYAIGDCTNHFNTFLGRHVRLESVPSALEQARICAAAIAGKAPPPHAAPWFWSDQYDLKLQMVGLSPGYEKVVIRGSIDAESFCAFYLKNGTILAADAVNRPQDFMVAKKFVASRARVPVEHLADERVGLELRSIQ